MKERSILSLMETAVTASVTLTGAVLVYVASTFNKQRDLNSENISQDRKKWRENIREIASKGEDLENADYQKILSNINSYKPDDTLKDFIMKDQHIKKTVKANIDEHIKSEIVKDYLRLLLKFDWERSKCDTQGGDKKQVIKEYINAVSEYAKDGKYKNYTWTIYGTSMENEVENQSKKFSKKLSGFQKFVIGLLVLMFIVLFSSTFFLNNKEASEKCKLVLLFLVIPSFLSCAAPFSLSRQRWIFLVLTDICLTAILFTVQLFGAQSLFAEMKLNKILIPFLGWTMLPFLIRAAIEKIK